MHLTSPHWLHWDWDSRQYLHITADGEEGAADDVAAGTGVGGPAEEEGAADDVAAGPGVGGPAEEEGAADVVAAGTGVGEPAEVGAEPLVGVSSRAALISSSLRPNRFLLGG